MFDIEHDAQVRALRPAQRMLYHALLALALACLLYTSPSPRDS